MFLQSGPAETTNYMILGFAVIFGVLFVHLASFAVRQRSLAADLKMLQQVNKKSTPKRAGKAKPKKKKR